MKRFIKKVVAYAFFCVLLMTLPSVIIDPYNVFHWNQIRQNGVEPNKNYIKTKYVINNPELFSGFLFGSSRVGSIHVENIADAAFYNMTYSNGTPSEHLATLKTFLDNGVNVQYVAMGVDSFSYTEDPETHNYQGLRSPYQFLKKHPSAFATIYFSPSTVLESLKLLFQPKRSTAEFDAFYDYGWWCEYGRKTTIDWDKAEPSFGKGGDMDETLNAIREMKDLCESHNIRFILFTNPMHEMTYRASVEEKEYLLFLEKLVEISPYYNFSGINRITTKNDYYIDTSHYNAYVGDMMINVMFAGKKYEDLYRDGFGWYVTGNNIVEFIGTLT